LTLLGSASGGDLDPANPLPDSDPANPLPDSNPRRINSDRSDPQLPPDDEGGLPTVKVLKSKSEKEVKPDLFGLIYNMQYLLYKQLLGNNLNLGYSGTNASVLTSINFKFWSIGYTKLRKKSNRFC
jgi:hypothetical protein